MWRTKSDRLGDICSREQDSRMMSPKTENDLMIRSIHRLSLSGVQPTSNPFGCGVTGVLLVLCLWLVPVVLALLIAGTSVRAQTVTTLYSYVDNAPPRRLVQGNNGNFYAIVGGGLLV